MKRNLFRSLLVLSLSILLLPPLLASVSIADEQRFSVRPEVSEDARDSLEDFEGLKRAAREGDTDALNSLGVFHFREEDFSEAADCFQKAARKGHAIAMYNVGLMQLHGWGVSQSHSDASESFETPAQLGVPAAQYNLGMLHLHGIDGAVDLDAAVHWLANAAEQGFALAQNNLGNVFLAGMGVDADPQAAAGWYRKAAEQGNSYAQSSLGQMLLQGTQIEGDLTEAALWLGKAAEQGVAEAQYHFGMMNLMGHGLPHDPETAAIWMRNAAEQDYADAQANFGVMHANGVGVSRDLVAAYKWLTVAEANGKQDAGPIKSMLGERMTTDQISEAERLAQDGEEGKRETYPDSSDVAERPAESVGEDESETMIREAFVREMADWEVNRSTFTEWMEGYEPVRRADAVMNRIVGEPELADYIQARIEPGAPEERHLDLMVEYALEKDGIEPEVKAWLRFIRVQILDLPWADAYEAFENVNEFHPEDLPPKAATLLMARSSSSQPRDAGEWSEWAGIFDSALTQARNASEQVDLLTLGLTALTELEEIDGGEEVAGSMWRATVAARDRAHAQGWKETAPAAMVTLVLALSAGEPAAAAEIAERSGLKGMEPSFLMLAGKHEEAADRLQSLRLDSSLSDEDRDFLHRFAPLVFIFANRFEDAREFIESERRRPALTSREREWLLGMEELLENHKK